MSARGLYARYLRLLEKWPADETKKGRDLGEVVRQRIVEAFSGSGGASPEVVNNAERCEAHLLSLTRIANNYHRDQNLRARDSSASGCDFAACHAIVSNEVLQMAEKEASISKRLLSTIKFGRGKDDSGT